MLRHSIVFGLVSIVMGLASAPAFAQNSATPALSSTQEDSPAGDPHGAIKSLGGMGTSTLPPKGAVTKVPSLSEGPARTGGAPLGTSTGGAR